MASRRANHTPCFSAICASKLFKPADARGPPNDPQMQADREHARSIRALGVEPIEGRDAVAREILGMDEGAAGLEAHVVGVEGIGQHDDGARSRRRLRRKADRRCRRWNHRGNRHVPAAAGACWAMSPSAYASPEAALSAGRPGDRRYRAGDTPRAPSASAMPDVALPAPAMGRDLVAIGDALLARARESSASAAAIGV